MPQRRAAKKALRQNKKQHQRNLQIKQKIKSAIKKFKKSLDEKDASLRQGALKEVYKTLDRAAVKKVIHKNKVARKKSRFSKLLNANIKTDKKPPADTQE